MKEKEEIRFYPPTPLTFYLSVKEHDMVCWKRKFHATQIDHDTITLLSKLSNLKTDTMNRNQTQHNKRAIEVCIFYLIKGFPSPEECIPPLTFDAQKQSEYSKKLRDPCLFLDQIPKKT